MNEFSEGIYTDLGDGMYTALYVCLGIFTAAFFILLFIGRKRKRKHSDS